MYRQNSKRDVYHEITDTIVRAVEQNQGTLEMPWHRHGNTFGRPRNAQTRKPYSGVNILTLWVEAERNGYGSELWATYRQWQSLEAQVRKGEKGTSIVFYKQLEREIIDEETGELETKTYLYARTSKVFNADQVKGYSAPTPKPRSLVDIIQGADELVASTHADIRHGGGRAFYNQLEDYIRMPEQERFTGTSTSTATESYYAVLLHEITHWTGHESRLDRDLSGRFGQQSYAMEELVAELGGAFLCADLGVTNSPRPDHAAYIANWLEVMKKDAKAIFTAASKASHAADYLKGLKSGSLPNEASKRSVDADDCLF